jgi:phage head maturation protease
MPAIGVHHTDVRDGAWDGPEMRRRLRLSETEEYYRKAHAWQDPEGDPESKAAYSFIHHFVSVNGEIGAASVQGCLAGIAVLNGARIGMGGVRAARWAPDREGIYRHLAAHLRDAGVEPPELVDLGEALDEPESKATRVEDLTLTDEGEFVCRFSTFGVVDAYGDVTTRSTFTDGQEVPVGAWGHNRLALPVGRGTVRVHDDGAYLEGRFFLDTTHGRDTYLTVKNLGELQQWSYLFLIQEAAEVELDGKPVRELRRVDLISVDPVDRGAGYGTQTIAIKGAPLLDDLRGVADELRRILGRLQERAQVRARTGRGLGTAASDARTILTELRSVEVALEGLLRDEPRRTRSVSDGVTASIVARAALARARALETLMEVTR